MLQDLDLFEGVPETDIGALENHAVLRRYPKNTIVVMEDDTQSQLFVIRSGKVRVFANDEEGKQVTLKHMGPGEYFGELSVLDRHPRSASIASLTDVELLTIAGETFRDVALAHPKLLMSVAEHLVSTVRGLTESVKDMALLDVYGRVTRVLQRLSEEGTHSGEPKVTHQDIANMVGASREMVSRVMKELVRGDYIDLTGGRVQINKPLPKNW